MDHVHFEGELRASQSMLGARHTVLPPVEMELEEVVGQLTESASCINIPSMQDTVSHSPIVLVKTKS